MLAAGCGCPAVPFSNSFSTVTVLWALEGELTPQETTSGRSFTINFSLCPDIQYSIIRHIKPLCNLTGCGANGFLFSNARQAIHPNSERLPQPVHLWAMECPWVNPEGSQLCGGGGLPQTYDKPCRRQQAQYWKNETSLPATVPLQRTQ